MDGLHSREALAGYERRVLDSAVVTVVGAGMIANNLVQTLALSGVGELRIIDFDHVDRSNLTRSPLFGRASARTDKPRAKARELALAALSISYAESPRVRYAVARLEEVGLGALAGSHVIVGAVDNHATRALLADWTRLLGVPFVEAGVAGHEGHVAVFPNASPDEPCWRCAFPTVEPGGFSCRAYAAEVAAEGRIPATQALGATFGAGLLAEHTILALHREYPLAGRMFDLDLRTARTNTVSITRDPDCPGVHVIWRDVTALDVSAQDPLERLFAAVDGFERGRVRLPFAYVVEAPCATCGAAVRLGRPAFAVTTPSCRSCSPTPVFSGRGVVTRVAIAADDPEAKRPCRALGLAPGSIFELESACGYRTRVCRLSDGIDALFSTRTREPIGNETAGA